MSELHVVIGGLPRSGSTLLYNMIRAAAPEVVMPPQEVSASKMMGAAGDLVTKRPKDVFAVEEIIAANKRDKTLRLILTVRDPRSVLVSVHASYPHQPFIGHDHCLFVTPDVLANIDSGLMDSILEVDRRQSEQTLPCITVRFEDLVRDPDVERARVADHTGLTLNDGFERFHEGPIPELLMKPLNGVRPLDSSRVAPWRTEAGAARVVRQFRLAPQLFDALEAWGYEADRHWYDELAQIAPAGLDDSPGLIVGFYTDDAVYRREADRLERSVRRLQLPLELVRIPATRDWLAAVRFKAEFLADMRRRHRGRLLYVDVDAVLHRDPWPHLNGYDCDVGFNIPQNGRAQSGTILLADSEGAVRFLEDWAGRLSAAPEAWDQHPLSDIVQEHRQVKTPPYRVHLLPSELCYVFDQAGKVDPIIEHLQASRESRTDSATALDRLERRRGRVQEVDRIFFD